MCLRTNAREEFILMNARNRKKSDYMIGYKVYSLNDYGRVRSVTSPYMFRRLDTTNQVVKSDYLGKAGLRYDNRIVEAGIHFCKTKKGAKELAYDLDFSSLGANHRIVIVKVYAKVSDLLGVGEFGAVAKKIIIDYKDLKRLDAWVNGGKK